MFGIDSGELLIIAMVALVVIGPKDLPRVMRTIGHWVGRARGMARHFRSGIDAMMREAELEEMEKRWKADNERIMREHPGSQDTADAADSDWGKVAQAPQQPNSGDIAGMKPIPPSSGSRLAEVPSVSQAPPAPPKGARPRVSRT